MSKLNIWINVNKIEEEENKQNEENKSIDNDKEPDPRINFEQIQKVKFIKTSNFIWWFKYEKKIFKVLYKIIIYRTNYHFFQKP